jgi:sugar phosphate isomerase/epimerase
VVAFTSKIASQITPDNPDAEGPRPTLNRRTVLQGAAALAALWAGGPSLAAAPGLAPPALGIQLYTMREFLARDFAGTLAALRKIGYAQVETAGLMNHDPASFRAALDAAGMTAPSGHIFPKAAQPLLFEMASKQMPVDQAWAKIDAMFDLNRIEDMLADMFEQSQAMGYQYLVLASMDPKLLESMAGIKVVCDAFRRGGELCHQHGLKFAWHPHLKDWGMVEGKRAAEHILDGTDPNRVFIELDFFWAAMVNVDIPQFLNRYRGRVQLGHIKDLAKGVVVPAEGFKDFPEVKDEYFEDVGHGQFDYLKWIPLAREAGMRYFFVERDYSPDALQSAARSYRALHKIVSG